MDYKFKEKYNMDDLLEIMAILRGEDGCPWDKEQDHKSIRKNFIEETYEVIEAIDNDDKDLLKEELGDVLLQVVFHAQMEKEMNSFDFNDVADGICKKLIERHEHIFGDIKLDNSDEVLIKWEAIKKRQKGQIKASDALSSVPSVLPSLMRAQKLTQRAEKAELILLNIAELIDSMKAKIALLETLENSMRADENEQLIGEALMDIVRISTIFKIDSEEALYKNCENMIKKAKIIEYSI